MAEGDQPRVRHGVRPHTTIPRRSHTRPNRTPHRRRRPTFVRGRARTVLVEQTAFTLQRLVRRAQSTPSPTPSPTARTSTAVHHVCAPNRRVVAAGGVPSDVEGRWRIPIDPPPRRAWSSSRSSTTCPPLPSPRWVHMPAVHPSLVCAPADQRSLSSSTGPRVPDPIRLASWVPQTPVGTAGLTEPPGSVGYLERFHSR